jgi:putative tryptophan/tyrosine transport system substrate-binding protein
MQLGQLKRREFIMLLGGTAAWPVGAHGQQTLPVVGYLGTVASDADRVSGFRDGLRQSGYVEDRDVSVEYRWVEGHQDQFLAFASELAAQPAGVIVAAGGTASALAAQRATRTIPIVFAVGNDPVKFGLVASLNRPGGNLTGVSSLSNILVAKQFEILNEAFPKIDTLGFLVNVNNPNADTDTVEAGQAARSLSKRLLVLEASNDSQLDLAFEKVIEGRIGALVVAADPFFMDRRDKLITMSDQHALPTVYDRPEWVSAGGLMSYGTSITDTFRQVGLYTGRILKGERPEDMPVQQAVKIVLALNLKTAKRLGTSFPATLIARADEVIE